VDNPPALDPKIKAFRGLRNELREKGYFKPNMYWQLYKCITTVGFLVLGTIATYYGNWIMGAVLVGIGFQQLGWLGHDACHHGLTPNRKLNNALGYFFGNVLNGFSVNWWKDRHNSHHATTNILDADPDIDNIPMMAWSPSDLDKAPTWTRRTLPYQAYYFLFLLPLLRLTWCFNSIFFCS